MISKIKLISSKDHDKEIEIEHDHMPQYDIHYMKNNGDYLLQEGKWLPILFKNDINSGRYDEALLQVNKKVTYKLSNVEIDSNTKELHFNQVETIFKF